MGMYLCLVTVTVTVTNYFASITYRQAAYFCNLPMVADVPGLAGLYLFLKDFAYSLIKAVF